MKKQFIITGIIALLGILNSTYAGAINFRDLPFRGHSSTSIQKISSTSAHPPSPPTKGEYDEIIKLLKQQLALKSKQLAESEKALQAIAKSSVMGSPPKYIIDSFLAQPELLYKGNQHSKESYKRVQEEEQKISGTIDEIGKALSARLQFTSSLDKAVTLKTFEHVKNRFEYLNNLLDELPKQETLKDIADFQTHIDGVLALIQNESIKMQMITHLRNAEHTLIKMKRREVDMKFFNHEKTGMPTIR
ncbi:type IV secretion system protein [Bartonella gabonensis]|uniref:type IV secretion system protein n=1 Tax=Bartonella gabonensis TaxID=2699889 RepID=UPI00158E147E|nr:type IV secretion system protein [Bartonella gabonensis]